MCNLAESGSQSGEHYASGWRLERSCLAVNLGSELKAMWPVPRLMLYAPILGLKKGDNVYTLPLELLGTVSEDTPSSWHIWGVCSLRIDFISPDGSCALIICLQNLPASCAPGGHSVLIPEGPNPSVALPCRLISPQLSFPVSGKCKIYTNYENFIGKNFLKSH